MLTEILLLQGRPERAAVAAYLRAAWKAEDLKHLTRAAACRLKAAHHFQLALEKQEVELEDVPRFQYLIGEIFRRAGKFEEALSWFDKVQSDKLGIRQLLDRQKEMALTEKIGESDNKRHPTKISCVSRKVLMLLEEHGSSARVNQINRTNYHPRKAFSS